MEPVANTRGPIRQLYGGPESKAPLGLGLLTDLYQLTMAYGYWRNRMADHQAVFHLSFRRAPFGGQYAVACGLEAAAELMEHFGFSSDDCGYLAGLRGADGEPLFDEAFLRHLESQTFACDVSAVAEGTAVLAHEPLLRIEGPLLQTQLLETCLLTVVNFQTLVATKASRICRAARGAPVLEFGLRRAQGIDGGLSASRAAYVGGCAATSNVLAGKLFDIPVKGTHAHSWVMSFDDELASFRAYAAALPNNSLFLVDTFDTLEGVRKAVAVGRELQRDGHRLLGIRLDSGDLTRLSREARRLLDAAGMQDAVIVASNDLDEYEIEKLLAGGAAIGVWGVGTRLATAYDQPALGGVYKLSAIRESALSPWAPRIKLSEEPIKVSLPGRLQVRRFRQQGKLWGDVIYNLLDESPEIVRSVGLDGGSGWSAPRGAESEDLLAPWWREGRRVRAPESAGAARRRAARELEALPEESTRWESPAPCRLGLTPELWELKRDLIDAARRPPRSGDAAPSP